MFGITAIKVITMMAYGVPGYLLIKTGAVKENAISAFAKFLLYVCSPAILLYSFNLADCTKELLINMGIFLLMTFLGQLIIIGLYALIFKKKLKDSAHRIAAVAGACGNVGFLGLPLLQHLLPEFPEAAAYSAAFSVGMNFLAWTVGLMMITGNRKYISFKAAVLNPSTLAFLVAFPLFLFKIKLPALIEEPIAVLGKASTPVCMTVLGMRLATKKFRTVFQNRKIYSAAVAKLFVFPVLVTLLMYFIPMPQEVKSTAFILCCCPAAALVQSLAEAYGGDSVSAADIVLSTNLLCILTIPLMWTAYTALFL